MTYVLDTDHLGEYQKGTSPASQRLIGRLDAADEPVAITIISVEEVMRGWMAAIRRENDPHRQKRAYDRLGNLFRFFARWHILPWDDAAIAEFDGLVQNKIRIGTMDLKIASIALANDATVLTCNARDFGKVPNLRFEDWLA
jgi:tRNA(fMet)-specific endonuclease VapC